MKDKSRDTVPLRRGGIYSLATVCTYSDSRCPLYTVYVCNIVNIHYTFPHQTYREMDIKRKAIGGGRGRGVAGVTI